jgi:hypothetical protein
MRAPCRLLPALPLLLATPPAEAGIEEGRAYFLEGEYLRAFSEFRPLAEAGDPEAAFYLGEYYHHGLAGPADFAKALQWYRFAAERGVADAQLGLGAMYATGRGVPKDYIQAYMWLSLAAGGLPPGKDRDKIADTLAFMEESMSPAAREEARLRIRHWKPVAE